MSKIFKRWIPTRTEVGPYVFIFGGYSIRKIASSTLECSLEYASYDEGKGMIYDVPEGIPMGIKIVKSDPLLLTIMTGDFFDGYIKSIKLPIDWTKFTRQFPSGSIELVFEIGQDPNKDAFTTTLLNIDALVIENIRYIN